MFWNKKQETPSLETRIIDLMKLNWTEIEIGYNKYIPKYEERTWFHYSCTIHVWNKDNTFAIWYTKHNSATRLICVSENNQMVELNVSKWDDILSTAEEMVKNKFIKQMFPVDPEISKISSS